MPTDLTTTRDRFRTWSRWLPLLVVLFALIAALATGRYLVAVAIAVGLGPLVLNRRVAAAHDRREITWLDAWMKTSVIVVGLIVSIVIVPAKVLELKTVQDLPRAAQDLITMGLWSGALGAALLGLWYAHRERRI